MEPLVQYATTSDGYNIAYTVRGDGPSLVCLPFAFSHAQQVWSDSSVTPFLRALSEHISLVYYDSRGQGLSQRGLSSDTRVDSFLSDLQAVLGALRLRRVGLIADNFWTHVAVRMAVENPDRVAVLVLMHCTPSFSDQVNWLLGLARQNWDYYLDVLVGTVQPATDNDDQAARAARKERLKSRMTQGDWLQTLTAYAASDISGWLPRLKCPVLVLHVRDQRWITQESATQVAAQIPNGRLSSLGGSGHWGDTQQAAQAILEFLETITDRDIEAPRSDVLSARELDVLRLIATGKSNQQIAEQLVISLNTVKRHVNNILTKTGAANRAEATSYAFANNLIGP